jgi:hypothetical protein
VPQWLIPPHASQNISDTKPVPIRFPNLLNGHGRRDTGINVPLHTLPKDLMVTEGKFVALETMFMRRELPAGFLPPRPMAYSVQRMSRLWMFFNNSAWHNGTLFTGV